MEDKVQIEKWTLEDGRRAERHIKEVGDERIIELHIEELRPMRLQQRIVEKVKPFVYEREIEMVDSDGNVVEKKVEAIEPKVQLQLVDHIAVAQTRPVNVVSSVKEEVKSVNGVRSFGVAEEIAKQDEKVVKVTGVTDKILMGVIGLLAVGVVYMLFFM